MFKKVDVPSMTSAGLKVGDSVIDIEKIEELYVEDYTTSDKMKRALLIAFVFSFVGLLVHPLYAGLPIFLLVFWYTYAKSPVYELRAIVKSGNPETQDLDTGLHKTICREDYILVIEKFHAIKAYNEMTAH
ncbi:hypothetical protein INR79_20890 [Vibrio sp. SCSIO 43132]|uniref:hypothetical protein n=1 Tax=Vibrio sp. SCSIO 43132 TaxID=2779363 RepID=UPI001CA88F36|nr:hypothetical protein [Vibrio sp. SCSIO 43132]UAB73614.1 hypothetical protein INR79_20890 [Vibrio sp. SCSIO 43132]